MKKLAMMMLGGARGVGGMGWGWGVRRAVTGVAGAVVFLGAMVSGGAGALAAVAGGEVESAGVVDAREILRGARLNRVEQRGELRGRLRTEKAAIPFWIGLREGEIEFRFEEPAERYILRLREEGSELLYAMGDGAARAAEAGRTVRGTPITAMDLSLGYLYWPRVKYLGREKVRTRPAYLLEVNPPGRGGPYGVVRVWVDEQTGALLRMEGYDWEAQLVKRFEMVSAQRVQGQWFLKAMRVEAFEPGQGVAQERVYLEVDGE